MANDYRSYKVSLQRALAEYLPMQLLMIYYVGVVLLAALLEPLNELCVKRSWREVCLYL